jgi:glycosyltransferase involved in cell wall biosynthesis
MVKYKNLFPKYYLLNWISMSFAQRNGMPKDTNWVGNVYHGLHKTELTPLTHPSNDYIAYLGRIIQPKGLHLVIQAVKQYNQSASKPLKLKIAGKHYAGHKKDTYWQEQIVPLLDDPHIEYSGFVEPVERQSFLGNAKGLIIPSLFEEPFGLVTIEALACGTPVIGLASGALPEVIKNGSTGFVVSKSLNSDGTLDTDKTVGGLVHALTQIDTINRKACRKEFEERFTAERMCQEHLAIYKKLTLSQDQS